MRIAIFGTGYVGLVTGACLAEMGNHVLCIDVDATKVEGLRQGRIPIFEPGLAPMVQRNRAAGLLDFSTDAAAGVAHGEALFIAVGTPPDEDGSADLRHVLTVAASIGLHLDRYAVVVNKSTVPVGTAERVRATIAQALAARGAAVAFDVASNPEFLKEGDAVNDCMRPDRIIIGSDSAQALALLKRLYAPFNRNHERIVTMDARSAELTKYAANAMLATRISFMNELALLAEKMGADIEHVRHGIGSDPRIGFHFLYAGCGYGGSCFPKDVQALRRTAKEYGSDLKILNAVEAVNDLQKEVLLDKITAKFGKDLSGKNIALWGLAFKPNTDDMREAPSRVLIQGLWARGATVTAYDPVAAHETRRIYGDDPRLKLAESPMAALEGADALVIVTEWQIFRAPDFSAIKSKLKTPVIFDGRNLYELREMQARGIEYYCIGRLAA